MNQPAWRVVFAPTAERELRRLPPDAAAFLGAPILALAADPRPPGHYKISGSDLWRIRVRDVRVVYAVRPETRTIVIVRIARRSERTYRRLR
ncbi:MAG: type II toxin-antitoxin system RelE family toxin [Candidatus Limnocylindrales bacterium]